MASFPADPGHPMAGDAARLAPFLNHARRAIKSVLPLRDGPGSEEVLPGGKSVDDLLADVQVKLCAQRTTPLGGWKPWIWVVARNAAIDALRSATVLRESAIRSTRLLSLSPEDDQTGSWLSLFRQIADDPSILDDRQRDILLSRGFRGEKTKEIAMRVGLTPQGTRKAFWTALERVYKAARQRDPTLPPWDHRKRQNEREAY